MAKRLPDPATIVEDMIAGAGNNANKWLRNTVAGAQDMVADAQAAGPAWEAGIQAAMADKAWQASMSKLNPAEIAASVTAAGASSYSSGISRKRVKIERAIREFHPHLQQAVDQVRSMPRNSVADRKERMLANFDKMVDAGKAYRGITTRR